MKKRTECKTSELRLRILTVLTAAVLLVTLCFGGAVLAADTTGAGDEYEEKSMLFDFEDDIGANLEDSSLADMFKMQIVRAAGGDAVVGEDGVVSCQSYAGFVTDTDVAYDYFAGAYTFSLDYDYKGQPTLGGIFVRMVDPDGYTVTNPKNASVQQAFSMFEWDWYKENNGKQSGVSSIGGSGIRVYEDNSANSIGIAIKTRVEDGLYVFSQGVLLAFPDGFNKDGLNNYKFVDDAKGKLEIYVNEVLFATVEYGGEPGTYPDGDEGDSDLMYYKQAVVKDAAGTELLSVDNARINAEYSACGIGNRGGDTVTQFDNVKLTWLQKKKAATPEPTAQPATQAPAKTEAPAANTDAPVTTQAATAQPGGNTSNGGNSFGTWLAANWLYVLCGVLGLAAIAVIVIVLAKKKRK